MKRRISVSIVTFCMVSGLALAQVTGGKERREWGPGVQGVLLSISTSNSVVQAGFELPLEVVMKNASTNDVHYDSWRTEEDFAALLKSSTGRGYSLIEPPFEGGVIGVTIKPGQELPRKFGISLPKDLEPGDYTLSLCTLFDTVTNNGLMLESNHLKLRIENTNSPSTISSNTVNPLKGLVPER